MPTCFINVGQSVSDHTGTDGLNWFSVSLCGLSMLRQITMWPAHCHVTYHVHVAEINPLTSLYSETNLNPTGFYFRF